MVSWVKRHKRLVIGLAVVGVVAAVTAVWALVIREVEPENPTAFYDPPDPIPSDPPGTIVRSEPIDRAPAGASATLVMYTSTDPAGTPIAVTGVVFAPSGAVPEDGRPVVAWAHGTSGVASRCAPSLLPRGGRANIPELESFLDAGVVVVATDYPGLGTPGPHPYLVGESEGRAVLDSVRAAQNVVGEDAGSKVTVFGHSQGGHSTIYAAEIAPTYAPELDLVAVAAMAPPTNLAELVVADEGSVSGVLLTALAIDSWSHYYPDTPANAIVHEEFIAPIRDLARKCIFTNDQDLVDVPDIVELRDRFLSTNPVEQPAWKPHFAANTPTEAPLPVPLLVAQGSIDEIVKPDVTRAYVERECAAGGNVEYKTYPEAGHFAVRTVAAPDVRDWMLARLDGQPASSDCPIPASTG